MEFSNFRDLRVWQAAMDLVDRIYSLTRDFPRQEVFGLASQMQRAAVSIPANIAEGHNRHHSREYVHHLSIAEGSLAELETHLEIALRQNYVAPDDARLLLNQAGVLGRQLVALRKSLNRRIADGPP